MAPIWRKRFRNVVNLYRDNSLVLGYELSCWQVRQTQVSLRPEIFSGLSAIEILRTVLEMIVKNMKYENKNS